MEHYKVRKDVGEKGLNIEDTEGEDTEKEATQEREPYEEDTWEEPEEPLELGGFLTRVHKKAHFITTPTNTPARDLSVGQVILFGDRPREIVGKTASLAPSGPLASRHKIALELIELFDKEALTPVVVKAKEEFDLVPFARVRYTVLGFEGPNQDTIMLQKQHRDTAKRSVVKFFVSGGKIGDELAPFFTQCDEEEDRPAQTITLLILEAVDKYQLVGFGIGDWESLG